MNDKSKARLHHSTGGSGNQEGLDGVNHLHGVSYCTPIQSYYALGGVVAALRVRKDGIYQRTNRSSTILTYFQCTSMKEDERWSVARLTSSLRHSVGLGIELNLILTFACQSRSHNRGLQIVLRRSSKTFK